MSEKLYRVLEAQATVVTGTERERVLGKMAVTSAEGLSNVDHSIKLYRELLEKNPRNEQAFEALNTLLERGQKAEELRELLQWKLQFTVDPRELVRLNERLGRVLWQQLNRGEDAVPFFKAALERDARHRGALEALRDIFEALEPSRRPRHRPAAAHPASGGGVWGQGHPHSAGRDHRRQRAT